MRKQAYNEPVFNDEEDVLMQPSEDSVAVRIRGLTHVRDDIFRVQFARHREIDWGALFRAIGEPDDGSVDERLAESIGRAIRRHDFMQILADRMIVD